MPPSSSAFSQNDYAEPRWLIYAASRVAHAASFLLARRHRGSAIRLFEADHSTEFAAMLARVRRHLVIMSALRVDAVFGYTP